MNDTNQMVSVPCELLEQALDAAAAVGMQDVADELDRILTPTDEQHQGEYPPCDYCGIVPDYHPWHGSGTIKGAENRHIHACDGCRSQLPAHPEQHQGEPVALPARMPCGNITEPHHPWAPGVREGWNKCLDEIAKLGPLFARTQLAERDALLRDCFKAMPRGGYAKPLRERMKAMLSASPESSGQAERDERAAFETHIRHEWPMAPISRKRDLLRKDDPRYGDYCDESLQRAWIGWQLRAALECKP